MKDDDVIEVKSREDLKKVSDQNKCPCSGCIQQDGCPAPAYCDAYKKWKKQAFRKKTIAERGD